MPREKELGARNTQYFFSHMVGYVAFLMPKNKHHLKIFGWKPQVEKEVFDRNVTFTSP